jgi:hypothetical protein
LHTASVELEAAGEGGARDRHEVGRSAYLAPSES